MKPLTREWVEKAEGDFATARRELRVRQAPNYDAVCFHAQQCAEKYLKACLQEADIPFGRTHNLLALLGLLLPVEPVLETWRSYLRALADATRLREVFHEALGRRTRGLQVGAGCGNGESNCGRIEIPTL